jgi:hypothetical protein
MKMSPNAIVSIIVFALLLQAVYILKPTFAFADDGTLKQFGVSDPRASIFAMPAIVAVLAAACASISFVVRSFGR